MSDVDDNDLQRRHEKTFDVAVDTRKFEIDLFWRRSLFFWGFIGAAFIAYAALMGQSDHDDIVILTVASFGLICSLAWTLANRGSKYWQNAWEHKVESLEGAVLEKQIFFPKYTPTRDKLHWWGVWSTRHHYSVSKLAIALSDFTVAVWVILLVRSIPAISWPQSGSSLLMIFIVGATVVYAATMLVEGRSMNERRDAPMAAGKPGPTKICPVCASEIPEAAHYCTACQSYLDGWRQILNIGPLLMPMIVAVITVLVAMSPVIHWALYRN